MLSYLKRSSYFSIKQGEFEKENLRKSHDIRDMDHESEKFLMSDIASHK